jgi:hypothetical protein
MGFSIEDGKGSGRTAEVDDEFRLSTISVSESAGRHINRANNKAWSIPIEGINPTATDDYFVYIKNTGNKSLIINDIRLSADTAATQLQIEGVTGTAAGGSTVTPVNKTIGAAEVPVAIVESGADITGLTSIGNIYFMQLTSVDTEYHLSTSSGIRIEKGRALAISAETATANITGVISLVEEE